MTGPDNRISITVGGRDFSLHHGLQIGSGAQLASYPMGTGGGVLSPVAKWPGHETDHSPLSNNEAKNTWTYCLYDYFI
jgi:hypothetical protein